MSQLQRKSLPRTDWSPADKTARSGSPQPTLLQSNDGSPGDGAEKRDWRQSRPRSDTTVDRPPRKNRKRDRSGGKGGRGDDVIPRDAKQVRVDRPGDIDESAGRGRKKRASYKGNSRMGDTNPGHADRRGDRKGERDLILAQKFKPKAQLSGDRPDGRGSSRKPDVRLKTPSACVVEYDRIDWPKELAEAGSCTATTRRIIAELAELVIGRGYSLGEAASLAVLLRLLSTLKRSERSAGGMGEWEQKPGSEAWVETEYSPLIYVEKEFDDIVNTLDIVLPRKTTVPPVVTIDIETEKDIFEGETGNTEGDVMSAFRRMREQPKVQQYFAFSDDLYGNIEYGGQTCLLQFDCRQSAQDAFDDRVAIDSGRQMSAMNTGLSCVEWSSDARLPQDRFVLDYGRRGRLVFWYNPDNQKSPGETEDSSSHVRRHVKNKTVTIHESSGEESSYDSSSTVEA